MSSPGSDLPLEEPASVDPSAVIPPQLVPSAKGPSDMSVPPTEDSLTVPTASLNLPGVSSSSVAPVAGPAVTSVATADLSDMRRALDDLRADVAAQARRVEACERRLSLASSSAAYWQGRCARLRLESTNQSSVVAELRETLKQARARVEHLRWQAC